MSSQTIESLVWHQDTLWQQVTISVETTRMRQALGNPAIPRERTEDGFPLPFILPTPPSPTAVATAGGELALWELLRWIAAPALHQLPPGLAVEALGNGRFAVTGLGGRCLLAFT